MTVFAISAMFSGIAGGLQVVSNEAANYVVFDASLSATVVLNSYIGGVGVFLGPALGAALMTFFGYAVSDLTQSWLLYQGVLFILVMMFMPSGLSGLIGTASGLRQRAGIVPLMPVAALSIVAALLLSGGAAFAVEMLQRAFSQDYRAMARLNPAGQLPPIPLFGRSWSPMSPATWLVPIVLFAIGGTSAYFARRRVATIGQHQSEGIAPHNASE
jgi:branched-chain amino acid transport system permease protein